MVINTQQTLEVDELLNWYLFGGTITGNGEETTFKRTVDILDYHEQIWVTDGKPRGVKPTLELVFTGFGEIETMEGWRVPVEMSDNGTWRVEYSYRNGIYMALYEYFPIIGLKQNEPMA